MIAIELAVSFPAEDRFELLPVCDPYGALFSAVGVIALQGFRIWPANPSAAMVYMAMLLLLVDARVPSR